MKKKTYGLGMAVLLGALLACAGVAQSAMWAGVELGGNFIGSTELKVNDTNINDVGFSPSVIGGVTIGYDFVNAGFGAYNWPDWMKYFSFATDLTFNHVEVRNTDKLGYPPGAKLDGYCVAWTFLFMAHYGFFPDSVVPSGRVNPYIGVGPAIVWSGLNMGTGLPGVVGQRQQMGNVGIGQAGSTNVALVVEPGIRWVALPNVSIDTAFRYRYAVPSYNFGNDTTVKVNPLNQFSFLVRANYHF
jgi:hypothetical protein